MFGNAMGPIPAIDLGFPDVCLTPAAPAPIPIPYPNIALSPMGTPPVVKVLFMCCPSHNMGTKIPQTNGDNAGVNTGVASGSVMGPSRHLTAAFTVLLKGKPATRLTSVSLQNRTNCPGMRIVPSQIKVLILAP